MSEVPAFLLSTKPENWNFDSVTETELEQCYFYEFGRELPDIRKRIARFRERCDTKTFDGLRALGASGYATVRGFSPRWKGIAPYCPEFPETPFLAIPAKPRRRRIMADEPLGNARLARAISFQSDLGKIMTHFRATDIRHGVIPSDSDDFGIVAFTIDWSLSDKELSREFQNWLRVYRKILSGVPVSEARGAGAHIRQFKKKLKALGAMRLLRALGWQKAHDLSADCRANGKPLYSDSAGWSRASREAETYLRQLSPKRIR